MQEKLEKIIVRNALVLSWDWIIYDLTTKSNLKTYSKADVQN